MQRDVFVSYSDPDRDCAVEMVARLEARGISTWIAPRDLSPASDWAAEIIDAIAAARAMVLVFSASSNSSPQVRREVERAVHKQLRILPFRVENVLPSKSLEYFLSAQHWLDAFPPPREPHYARLCDYLEAMLRPPLPVEAGEGLPLPAPLTERRLSAATAAHGFDAAELRLLEAQLAQHLGPVARHLVRRAALVAADFEMLTHRLAAELDSEQRRSQFLRSCRELWRSGS